MFETTLSYFAVFTLLYTISNRNLRLNKKKSLFSDISEEIQYWKFHFKLFRKKVSLFFYVYFLNFLFFWTKSYVIENLE